MPKEKDLVAYCGLYCGDCFHYKGRIADLARDLRKEFRQYKFDRRAEKMATNAYYAPFKNYQQCYELLGMMVGFRCKRGCRGNGGPPVCKIRECCREKAIEGCWLCGAFETCKTMEFLKKYHEDGHLKNLRILKKSGLDSFIKGKRYW
jgi:hypothetical protein